MGSRKKYEQAIADFDKAILINAKNASAYYNKALICEKAGRKAEAIQAFKKFVNCFNGVVIAPNDQACIDYAKKRIATLQKYVKRKKQIVLVNRTK